MPAPTTGRVPRSIGVHRDGDGTTTLVVDGRPFPYRVASHDAVTVDVTPGLPPQVRLTLIAGSVTVLDEQFAHLDDDALNHEHDVADHGDADDRLSALGGPREP